MKLCARDGSVVVANGKSWLKEEGRVVYGGWEE